MKKLIPIYVKSIVFLMMLLFLVSCKNQEEKLKDVGFWKYADGLHHGDVLDFNSENCKIKNDTIYLNDSPFAILKSIKSTSFMNHQEIIIQDLNSGETGRYVGK